MAPLDLKRNGSRSASGAVTLYEYAVLLTLSPQFLDGLYESGCNYWDTADVYGDSEDLIGKW